MCTVLLQSRGPPGPQALLAVLPDSVVMAKFMPGQAKPALPWFSSWSCEEQAPAPLSPCFWGAPCPLPGLSPFLLDPSFLSPSLTILLHLGLPS